MKLSDMFSSQAIAAYFTEAASNSIPYLGGSFFPPKKKAGLDLKWIKGHKGLPVSLMPSAFDAKSTLRDRIEVGIEETQMAFYRESMLIKEAHEQEIMRAQDSSDPYAQQVIATIFDDANTLIAGANVVPERMIMQLLAPKDGKMGIEIAANGVNHAYNYDKGGSWMAKHYVKIVDAASKWDASATCDPIKDLEEAMDAQEAASGNRPEIALMSKKTFGYIRSSEKIKAGILAYNPMAVVNLTSNRVKDYIQEELGLTIVVYTKKFKDESGKEHNFYADDIVMLLPNGTLGNTWYGTTPEERTLAARPEADVSIVNTGVAVAVTVTNDPVNTKTTVSEITLPSFERADECYALEVI